MKNIVNNYSSIEQLTNQYLKDVQLRNQLNEKYNDEVKRAWNIMKDYI